MASAKPAIESTEVICIPQPPFAGANATIVPAHFRERRAEIAATPLPVQATSLLLAFQNEVAAGGGNRLADFAGLQRSE